MSAMLGELAEGRESTEAQSKLGRILVRESPISQRQEGLVKDCLKCQSYKDCLGKPWFHYGEIRFCPFQILWIIEHSETMIANWPSAPEGSSYVDPRIHTGYRSEAHYAKSVGILGEVEYRLQRTRVDGKLLREQVENGKDIAMLAPEARSALMYIKGWRRKKIGYKRWLREVYFAPKTGKKHQLSDSNLTSRKAETYDEFKKRKKK